MFDSRGSIKQQKKAAQADDEPTSFEFTETVQSAKQSVAGRHYAFTEKGTEPRLATNSQIWRKVRTNQALLITGDSIFARHDATSPKSPKMRMYTRAPSRWNDDYDKSELRPWANRNNTILGPVLECHPTSRNISRSCQRRDNSKIQKLLVSHYQAS